MNLSSQSNTLNSRTYFLNNFFAAGHDVIKNGQHHGPYNKPKTGAPMKITSHRKIFIAFSVLPVENAQKLLQ